ncbi:MAG: Flp pilus assembly protein CpaB [Elusimicrobiota bacterium]
MKNKIQVVIAVCLSGLIAIFVVRYMVLLERKYRVPGERLPVLAAKRYIQQGAVLLPEMTMETFVPGEFIQPKAIRKTDDLLIQELNSGKRIPVYVTVSPILEGEQIIATKLSVVGHGTGIGALIPEGKRSFVIVCESDSVVGKINPGNRVDVLSVFDDSVFTVLQNVDVLAVGKLLPGQGQIQERKGRYKDDAPSVELFQDFHGTQIPVVIAVTPQEAQVIAMCIEKGRVFFSMRSPGDTGVLDIEPVRFEGVFKGVRPGVYKDGRSGKKEPADLLDSIHNQYEEAIGLLKKYRTGAKE